MLKRLDIVGFKSFADKTVFEFGDGVTGIVGPNGSGKSNIVDAVRWILGEQSAKSLRGGEMADVIFNGSASRKSLGLAEVSLTFDNSKRQLGAEFDEIQITRRVHRDGEGEYLINGQTSRLKDIKDLFLGSGAGNDAYCIIAQGKVESMLQASNKDRRTIFEEAAGISRFKAKKIETLRKLEKVDLNLQRLKDIVDEVQKQHRSIQLQASKAQRYKEHSERLKFLRVELGLQDFARLREKSAGEEQKLAELKLELDQRAGRAGACEAEAGRLEMVLADLDDHLREREAKLAEVRQVISTEKNTEAHEAALTEDLEKELVHTRQRLVELVGRIRTLGEAAAQAQVELAAAETQTGEHREIAEQLQADLDEMVRRLAELHAQIDADKSNHLEAMRRSAHWQNEASASKAQVENLRREKGRLQFKSEQAAQSLASLDVDLEHLAGADDQLQARLAATRQDLAQGQQERDRLRTWVQETSDTLSILRQEASGLASRIQVLEGLIQSHEGLGTGVREVLELLERNPGEPWGGVLGMIADFLTVKREYAPLIDLALGDWAQRFLFRDPETLAAALREREQPFTGRVSFLPLRPLEAEGYRTLRGNRLVELSLLSRVRQSDTPEVNPDHPGLVAPAVQVVSCDHPELADLPMQLLGRTLIVRDLATARGIAQHAVGFRLITLAGELLEPDGTWTLGAHHAETGILSRKSELLDLRERAAKLDVRIRDTDQDLMDLRDRLARQEAAIGHKQEEIDVLAEQSADLRNRLERHRERRQGLHEEFTLSREEMGRLDEEVAERDATWQFASRQVAEADTLVQSLQANLQAAEESIRQSDRDRQARQESLTQAQVALAKSEERLTALRHQHGQLARDLQQRLQENKQLDATLAASQARWIESQIVRLSASAKLAAAFGTKEFEQQQIAKLVAVRDVKRQERQRLAALAQVGRQEWRQQQELVHQLELATKDMEHQRETLTARLREDYALELATLFEERQQNPPAEPVVLEAETVHEEIEDLRKKLHRLGAVNMDALQELTELETRATDLQKQWEDLTTAKKSLEEIIGKINEDSRQLFTDSFTVIRGHFQELFRKLFGGGMAEIVLDDENDVLESGIEIIARPPGKELRSISLMSGGEKTMTAVALLLAIFRSKPSPFCILDEVDAALDEANIGRFTDVLREFLDQSQFIIVTHSKKTMACADVLYGITMQESGISKQVAVRFEDWVEDSSAAGAA